MSASNKTSSNDMITIRPYKKANQKGIDSMMKAIADEFKLQISHHGKTNSQALDKYWVAFHKKELIGTVGIMRIENDFCILKNMFVTKEYRGSGFGVSNKLLQHVWDWCSTEAMHRIYLGTMSQFKAAHKFYEKNGFQKIAKGQLPLNFIANPIDTVFYHRIL